MLLFFITSSSFACRNADLFCELRPEQDVQACDATKAKYLFTGLAQKILLPVSEHPAFTIRRAYSDLRLLTGLTRAALID